MTRFRRLAVLLVPLALGLASHVLPGRAQQATSSRFAFADTLLLRDTLGLDFSRLFPTADSVSVLPDTLRAWMIRWRLTIPRMLALADSMGYPVDSVGPVLDRERFNPLAARQQRPNSRSFQYSSQYDIQQTRTVWTNNSTMTATRGPLYLGNVTAIDITRTTTGGKLSIQENRRSELQADWGISKAHSIGTLTTLRRYANSLQGQGRTDGETLNEFKLAGRSRFTPRPGWNTDLNFNTGYLDNDNNGALKRGLSGDANGRMRINSRRVTGELSGRVDARRANARARAGTVDLRTLDVNNDLRGTIGILQSAPVSLLLNGQLKRSSIESPLADTAINRILTRNNSADATLRFRADNNRSVTTTLRIGSSLQSTGSRDDRGGDVTARWVVLGWDADGRYRENRSEADYPRRLRLYGYDESTTNRSAEGTLQRRIGERINAKLTASIGLDRSRYRATADSVQLPVDRDNYRQSYRVEGLYTRSERLSSGVGIEVALSSLVNIPGRATSSNNDLRSYRADWRWTYRLFTGLTANQTNSVNADYRSYPFAPDRNDLSLDYNSITNLSAVITPRLSINLSHNLREQPKGTYQVLEDGLAYLLPSDEGRNYTLRANVTYSPSPALSLTLSPDYQETSRVGNQNGVEVPQRSSKSLNFSGGANLNLTLGRKGVLTGNISRSFQSSRAITYQSGEAQISPTSEVDFWNGSLQLSWSL